jgi:hypothetical protein
MVAYPSRWRSSDPVGFSRVSGGEPSMAQMDGPKTQSTGFEWISSRKRPSSALRPDREIHHHGKRILP